MKYNTFEHPVLKEHAKIKRMIKHGEKPRGFSSLKDIILESFKLSIKIKNGTAQTESLILLMYHENKSTHYYVETNELYDFLSGMQIKEIPKLNSDIIESLLLEPVVRLDDGSEMWCNVGHIHYQLNEPALSFLILVSKRNNNNEHITLCLMRNNDVVYYGANFDLENIYKNDWGNTNSDYPISKVISDTQLVINFLIYKTMFPWLIINDAPSGQPVEYVASTCKKIKTEESLIDRSGVTPHFRRGHFAHLTSNRYKNAKGKYVFVKATYVKGFMSKTVIDGIDERKAM